MKTCMVAAAAASLTACSAAATPSGPLSLTSEDGKIHIVLTTEPDGPLGAGNVAVQLALTDPATHAPIEDEAIALVPFMPTMGHGTDVVPTLHAKGKGVYEFTDVNLFMPGQWQLRFQFQSPVSDRAAPDVEVH